MGKIQKVRIKNFKKWKTKNTKIGKYKGRDLWSNNDLIKNTEPPKILLFHHFCKLNKYENNPADFIKIEISYFSASSDVNKFEETVKDFLRENFNNSIANDAEYKLADVDDTDKQGDFQFLLRNRDISNSDFVKILKKNLDKVM